MKSLLLVIISYSLLCAESPETFDEYGGDEFEELGIFGNGGDDPFDDLMPDEVAVDFRCVCSNIVREVDANRITAMRVLKARPRQIFQQPSLQPAAKTI